MAKDDNVTTRMASYSAGRDVSHIVTAISPRIFVFSEAKAFALFRTILNIHHSTGSKVTQTTMIFNPFCAY